MGFLDTDKRNFKIKYLSHDTLFVKIELNSLVWQFSVSRKYHENEEKY